MDLLNLYTVHLKLYSQVKLSMSNRTFTKRKQKALHFREDYNCPQKGLTLQGTLTKTERGPIITQRDPWIIVLIKGDWIQFFLYLRSRLSELTLLFWRYDTVGMFHTKKVCIHLSTKRNWSIRLLCLFQIGKNCTCLLFWDFWWWIRY